VPLSTQKQPKQPTTKKKKKQQPPPKKQKKKKKKKKKKTHPQKPKPSMLLHVGLAFPKPGGRTSITVVDGAYQIQHLSLTFGLWTHSLNSSMEVLFNGF
jgi:hypothetical protein